MSDLLFGALAGDMGALNVLFILAVPIYIAVAVGTWLVNKARGR